MATLNARPRQERGKNAARALRREGRIPAVVYGHGEQTESLSIDSYDLERLLATVNAEATLFTLEVEGVASRQVLVREIQRHPFRPVVFHVDFYQIHKGERITVNLPLRLIGTPRGVLESGGVLDQVLYELHVQGDPAELPTALEIDISNLDVGESLHVSDVAVPGGARVTNDPTIAIALVTGPTGGPAADGPDTAADAAKDTGNG